MNQRIKWQIFDVYIFSTMFAINIFFGIFVFMRSDLTPNISLLIVTLPIIIIEGIRIFTSKKNYEHLKKEIVRNYNGT